MFIERPTALLPVCERPRERQQPSCASDLLCNKCCPCELLGLQPSLYFRAPLIGHDRLSPPLWFRPPCSQTYWSFIRLHNPSPRSSVSLHDLLHSGLPLAKRVPAVGHAKEMGETRTVNQWVPHHFLPESNNTQGSS